MDLTGGEIARALQDIRGKSSRQIIIPVRDSGELSQLAVSRPTRNKENYISKINFGIIFRMAINEEYHVNVRGRGVLVVELLL